MAQYLLSLGPTNFPSFTYIPLFEPITKTPKEWSNLNLITFSSLSHFTASTLFFTYYSGFIFPFIKQMHQLPSLCAYALSHFGHIWHFVTLWTVACQTPLSMEFSRQEYCSGLPGPSPGDLSDQGIEPSLILSPALQTGCLPLTPPGKPKYQTLFYIFGIYINEPNK